MKNETLDIILHLGTHNTTHYKQKAYYNKWMYDQCIIQLYLQIIVNHLRLILLDVILQKVTVIYWE